MRFFIICFLLQCYAWSILAQANVGANIDSDLSIQANLQVYAVGSFDKRDKSFEGSSLLFEDWQATNIKLSNRDEPNIEVFMLNYDLKDNLVIINGDNKIYSLPGSYLDFFLVFARNGKKVKYLIERDDLGVAPYKQIVSGEVQLLEKTSVKIVKSSYNVALAVGSVRPRLVKKSNLYISTEGQLYEVPSKKRNLKRNLNKLPQVFQVIIDEKADINDKTQLMSVINNYNKSKIEKNEISK